MLLNFHYCSFLIAYGGHWGWSSCVFEYRTNTSRLFSFAVFVASFLVVTHSFPLMFIKLTVPFSFFTDHNNIRKIFPDCSFFSLPVFCPAQIKPHSANCVRCSCVTRRILAQFANPLMFHRLLFAPFMALTAVKSFIIMACSISCNRWGVCCKIVFYIMVFIDFTAAARAVIRGRFIKI